MSRPSGEMVVQGIQNTEGSTLMTLAECRSITAEVKGDETDIVKCRPRSTRRVTVDALPARSSKAT